MYHIPFLQIYELRFENLSALVRGYGRMGLDKCSDIIDIITVLVVVVGEGVNYFSMYLGR